MNACRPRDDARRETTKNGNVKMDQFDDVAHSPARLYSLFQAMVVMLTTSTKYADVIVVLYRTKTFPPRHFPP